jgi:hypothetical protein
LGAFAVTKLSTVTHEPNLTRDSNKARRRIQTADLDRLVEAPQIGELHHRYKRIGG